MLPNSVMEVFEIHQRFKDYFLDELRVSFKLDNIFFWKLHLFQINIFSLSQVNFIFRKVL